MGFSVDILLWDREDEGKVTGRVASLPGEVAVLISRACFGNAGGRLRFGDQWRAGNFMRLELLGDD